MGKFRFAAAAFAAACIAPVSNAQFDDPGGGDFTYEYANAGFSDLAHTRPEQRLQALGSDLMGDMIDPNTGSIVFEHTDIAIPGNFGLEVALRRRRSQTVNFEDEGQMGFGDWAVEVPIMSFMYVRDYELNQFGNPNALTPRPSAVTAICPTLPDVYINVPEIPSSANPPSTTHYVHAAEYSQGVQISVPGRGNRQVLTQGIPGSGPINIPQVSQTTDHWRRTCDPAKGWILHAPNGDKYTLGKVAYRPGPFFDVKAFTVGLGGGAHTQSPPQTIQFPREHVVMMATEVTDVNGNWVRYEYANNNRGELTRIHSSDQREITLTYQGTEPAYRGNSRLVSRVSANGRNWNYTYHTGYYAPTYLAGVTLPDGRAWDFGDGNGIHQMERVAVTHEFECPILSYSFTIDHPNGMRGTFTIRNTRHLKSTYSPSPTPATFTVPSNAACEDLSLFPQPFPFFNSMSLVSKTLSGPQVPSMTWTYNYSGFTNGAVPTTKWTDMTDPLGRRTRMTYSRLGDMDGLLLKEELYAPSGGLVQRTDYTHIVEGTLGTPPRDYAGEAQQGHTYFDYLKDGRPRPLSRRVLTRGSDTYTTVYAYISGFTPSYGYGFPTAVSRSSNVTTGTRSVSIQYAHNFTKGILGLTSLERFKFQRKHILR